MMAINEAAPLLFIWFLNKAKINFQNKINPQTLASLTILITNSNPKEKEKMIGLVLMMLKSGSGDE